VEYDLLDAEHDGYTRLVAPLVHRRRIRFDKRRRAWLIQDSLDGRGEHDVELFLHLAQPVEERTGLAVRLRAPRTDLWIVPLDPPPGLALSEQASWVSRAYGHREPAPVLRYALRARVPLTLTTGLALVPHDTPLEGASSLFEPIRAAAAPGLVPQHVAPGLDPRRVGGSVLRRAGSAGVPPAPRSGGQDARAPRSSSTTQKLPPTLPHISTGQGAPPQAGFKGAA
jgi:hypothetical protein